MKSKIFSLTLVAAICALPVLAQNIPVGDDVWDSVGGGATSTTLSSADWSALCGAHVADTAVLLKGYNIPGLGTGDTVVTRLDPASLPAVGSAATVRVQLKQLSFVNDGPHPCSPNTIRVTNYGTQAIDRMTITRTGANGGTFYANVPVSALVEAVDASGATIGAVKVSGVLGDQSTAPWSYQPQSGGAVQPSPWYPGVDPVTLQPVLTCRIGKKVLPARHCYQPRPKCGVIAVPADPVPVPEKGVAGAAFATAIAAETCTLTTQQ